MIALLLHVLRVLIVGLKSGGRMSLRCSMILFLGRKNKLSIMICGGPKYHMLMPRAPHDVWESGSSYITALVPRGAIELAFQI